MKIRSSLKRKSVIALAVYLVLVITIIGTVSYLVVETPIRAQLERNLDLRTQIIASEIKEPLNRSIGILQSVVSIGNTDEAQSHQADMLLELFSVIDGVVVSGGLWPIPYSIDRGQAYKSLFFNRASDQQVDQIFSWNNPEIGGYDKESWYTSVIDQAPGSIAWSQVYIDPFTHTQMITASSPYFHDGVVSGVATVDISLENLVLIVRKYAEEYELGVVLKDAYDEVITEHNFHLVDGIYISSTDFGGFMWTVDVVNAHRLVTDQVYDLVSRVEMGIIPIMLVCVIMGYFLINQYIISPIVSIARNVDDSKEGGIIGLKYKSHDEIKHLIEAFNQKTVFLEAERQKAQASTKAKSSFLATLSHEIRTPMNGVLGTAQILLKTNLSEEQGKHMKTLYESGEHMMMLLNEILDFSKIEQGHLELEHAPFPLEAIVGSINSVYQTLCTDKGLQFKVFSEVPNERWYLSDKARLRQVLFNLLNNAVKFTSRGYVEVAFKEIQQEGKDYLSINVRDTGIGIAKDAQEKIFKPFEQAESSTTRRFGGTGLGLSIVKQLCELMEGSVTLTSEPGIGTSFTVLLAMEPCEPQPREVREHSKLNYHGLKALIVEDNRTNAIIIGTFMSNKGFKCDVVENGELAINSIANAEYDLVLMDNHMPVMDGVEATIAIRGLSSSKANILILGCTADVFRETRERMMSAGVDHIVAKPIDEHELDDALFRFSKRLYQYKPVRLKKPDYTLDEVEPLLLSLYVAFDNRDLFEAHKHLQALKKQVANIDDNHLDKILTSISTKLGKNEIPPQTDLDVLTVLLHEHCH
ncbi:hybrid sensor histidine kinase/response regulator [Vibrio ostreicida]|uniref:hybrid sensor histidine kinase/response regulator n=1 Tax=Vibrio ostreicida TaxID=526588 RepID=UPI000970C543|nr:hybrid sensor histidine kinase/response regulator [Vibrio ostreicida]